MNDKQIIILLVGLILISMLLIIMALMLQKKASTKSAGKQVFKSSGRDPWFILYTLFSKFILTKRYLQRIRKRIEMVDLSDNWTLSRKTMQFSSVSLGISVLMFVLFMLMGLNLYYLTISLVMIVIVHNQLIALFVDKIDNKLLVQFEKFLGDVRHHYHEHGMVDEAIYDAIGDCSYEMSLHGNKMYEVLSSKEPEAEIEKYNDIAPNKFFKSFLANCYTVQRFGDQIIDDESMFLSNLNYLKQEINMERLRRQRLDNLFNSLSIIAIAPIFALKPIESWGVSNLPEMAQYYFGSYGFIVQILLFIAVIFSYQLINRLKSDYKYTSVTNGFVNRVVRLPAIAKFLAILKNKQYSKYQKYGHVMKTVGIHESVEAFYFKRLCYFVLSLLACILVIMNIHALSRNNLLYKSLETEIQSQKIDVKAEQQKLLMDRKYILRFANQKATFQQIERALLKSGQFEDKQLAGIAAKRILDKVKKYEKMYFKWWELLISLFIASLFYHIPYLLMLFRKKVIQLNMEDEVMQFHTIILMLMNIERISVEDILKWMEQFAVVFKDSISRCLNNFENGDFEALEQLKADEPFVPFTRIVENLQAASDKITILRAFDQLKVERGYYQEKRKLDNEILVNRKGMWGKIIAYVPLVSTVFLYLIVPFILISITQLMSYSSQMSNAF
ncbi:MAG: hypothetical protein N2376_06805 [Clostridia bacterium]|nr:hypothetical protein [Clostridia bacterium]